MNIERSCGGSLCNRATRRPRGLRPRLERLEDRINPVTLEVPLLAELDLFGDQFAVVQVYSNDDGLGERVTFGIFDTGASPVTFGWVDQLFFELLGQPIPVIPGATVTAEGVGGSLTGLVSQPGTILADGMHAVDLAALLEGQESLDMSAAAGVAGVQAMIGTETGSPVLPAIVGTPIMNGGLTGALSGGVAARIDMQGYLIDFGALFPEVPEYDGLILPMPDVFFVTPGSQLTQSVVIDPFTGEQWPTTVPVRVPVDFIGIDNHLDPGTTITESYNPVVHGVAARDALQGVTLGVQDQTFLFDTGAQLSIVSTQIALELGLDLDNPETSIDIQGAGGAATVPGYVIDQLIVPLDDDNNGVIDGELIFTDVPIFVLDIHPEIDGILGMNLVNPGYQVLYDAEDPDGPGPAGPSLQFTFSTMPRTGGEGEGGAVGLLNALFPMFAGTIGGQGVPSFDFNHAPTVAADAGAVVVNEGQTAIKTGAYGDADGDPVQISANVGAITQSAGVWSWSLATTDGPLGPATVTVTADDGHGGVATTSFQYSVHNVAPTIVISGASASIEGGNYALTLGAVTDPGADSVADYMVHWGDGTSDTFASAGVKTHVYADGPASREITVDLRDEDGTFTDRANPLTVFVGDVAPTIALGGDAQVNRLATYTLQLGAVNDPGADVVTGYQVHWGDGISTGFIAGAPTGQALRHVYAAGGVERVITVDLFNDDAAPHPAAGAKAVFVANAAPNLQVVQKGRPAIVARGGIVTLVVTLTNLGNSPSTGVFTTMQLPAGLTFAAAASTPGWRQVGARLFRFNLGSLHAGQSVAVVFKARVARSLVPGSRLTTITRVGDDGANGPDAILADNVHRLITRVV